MLIGLLLNYTARELYYHYFQNLMATILEKVFGFCVQILEVTLAL